MKPLTSMEQRFVEICAHHESGHAMMAYFVGWSVDRISIVVKDEKLEKGSARYDYGSDQDHVGLIEQSPELFGTLTSDQQARNLLVAEKRIFALLGGPTSEVFFDKGIGVTGLLFSFDDARVPDNLVLKKYNSYLQRSSPNYNPKFLNEALVVTSILIKTHWKAIEEIARIGIKDHYVSQQQIESVFEDSGYFEYLRQKGIR